MTTAKLFWSGRSQAVRLPREFRFPGNEVRIRRHGRAVVLESVPEDWRWLDEITAEIDTDFVEAANEEPEIQTRSGLDVPFR